MRLKLIYPVLHLFEGGAGGAAGAPAGSEGGTAGTQGADTTASVASKQKGEYANVLFGKQDAEVPDADATTQEPATPTEQTQEERAKAYKDFIAQNKDLHDAEFQKVFDKRFKDYKTLQSKVTDQQDVIDRMLSRYNIENGDLKALSTAMDNDDAYYQQIADEQGMTVEQVKRLDELQRQNNMLMRTQQERLAEQEAMVAEQRKNEQVQTWMNEADSVKQIYPNFNLENEIANPRFQAMLKAGVPMADSYRAMHFDELMNQNAQATAAQTEKAVTDNIRAKGNRPIENGSISQSSFIVKNDVSKLTAKDRAEIARRVSRGEQISF